MKRIKTNGSVLLIVSIIIIFCIIDLFSQNRTLVIRGGKFLTVTQGVIKDGILIIRDGKISAIGENIPIPQNAKIIDVYKHTIVPGFIDAFTNIGTTEIESIDQDYD